MHLSSDLESFLHGRSFPPVLKASDVKGLPQQHRKKGLFHVNLLKVFITGQMRKDVAGVASQAVCFGLQ